MAQVLTSTMTIAGGERAMPPPRITVLAVPAMHCGGCMRKVEAALSAVPGVESARANLSSKRVTLIAPAHGKTAEPYIAALKAAGFEASLLADPSTVVTGADDGDLLKRLGVAGFAAANIMLLSIAVWSGHAGDMPASLQTLFHWLSALIALPVVAYSGQPFFRSALSALRARRLNMDVPISLGVLLATGMSLFQTWRHSEQVYFDAAVSLLFFLLIGRVLDQRVRARAASAAQNLLGLRSPAAGVVLPDGTVERIATADIKPGMRVRVAAGERVPVDGRIVRGASDIDQSLITGESLPQRMSVGDAVNCGTINLSASIDVDVTTIADDTVLADIARLMAIAEQARGRHVRLADRAAALYAPAVHLLGAVTLIGWLAMGYGWQQALTAAIAVLIVTCPCALALAVPAVQVVATGRLFRHGIVVKSADALERFAAIDTVIFDKTGTLSIGVPALVDADTVPRDLLVAAAALAAHSNHPYSRAVMQAARDRGLSVPVVEEVRETAGDGMSGRIGVDEVRLGSAAFCGVDGSALSVPGIFVKVGNRTAFALPMEDPLRSDAAATVARLRAEGKVVELLSGDATAKVREVAREVAADAWEGDVKPAQKLARIDELKRAGRHVLMVGDGLNDAPALAAGSASMSPSSAVDISQTAADAVFQGRRLSAVVTCLRVAREAQRRALENFAIAIGYNALFVPLAMAGQVTPLVAAIAMSASSLAVTLNALRLARDSDEDAR